jgi:hypothetical protein
LGNRAEVTGQEKGLAIWLGFIVLDEIVLWKQTWFRILLLGSGGLWATLAYKFNREYSMFFAYCLAELLFLVLFLKRTIHPSVILTKN